MEVDTAFGWEIKVDDHVHGLHVNTPCNEVRTDECLELSLSEPLETLDSFIRFHVRMQIFVLIFLLVELTREHFGTTVRTTKDNALVDDETTVNFEDCS
jgi:hypothetical protein